MANINKVLLVFHQIYPSKVRSYVISRQMSVQSMSEAISKAEICLGYSVKDLSVKQIVCNQKLKSLMREKSLSHPNEHPVLLAERKLDPKIEVNYKSRALLTLLLAKAVSHRPLKTSPQLKFNLDLKQSGSLSKQLLLAEIIELIYAGCVFHTIGISPVKHILSTESRTVVDTLLKGNRLAVLTGDLMFSSATKNLMKLKNSRVTELMSKAITDFIEGEYLNIKIREQIEIGNWTQILENWVRMTCLKSSSLIANGCQSMVHLSANCETLEEKVYKIGYNIGYAWNLTEELEAFNRMTNNNIIQTNTELLFSLPILLYFNSNPEIKNRLNFYQNMNKFIENISEEVVKSDSIKKSQSLIEFYSNNALDQIKGLPDCEAKTVLSDIVLALIQKQI